MTKRKPEKVKILISALILVMSNITVAQTSETSSTAQTPQVAPPASAETATTTSSDGKQVERVEVIGSRIKRVAKEGASAVKNVGSESMKNSANTSASESLRDSTLATYGVSRETSGSNAAATTTIGLRGFGETRTLILLNGHRLPKDPAAEAVDLNLVPQIAIERIEVLKDGASALYGSDALGGVINIVTKKGITHNEISAKLSGVEKPGGTAYDIAGLTGFSNEKSELMVVLNYTHQDKIFGKDREITKDGLSSTGSTGAWRNAGGTWTVEPGCPPDLVKPDASGNGNRCYFRYNEIATTRPQVAQLNLLTDYTYRLDSGLKLYNRNLIVTKDIEWSYAPTPIVIATPSGTASQPTARRVAYRLMEAGNRNNKDTEFNFSTLLGTKGNFTSVWDYDISASYSQINRKSKGISGYIDGDIINALILNGSFDPLAAPGARGSMNSANEEVFQDAKTELLTVDAVATGEAGEIGERPIGIAAGVSIMNEKLDQKADPKSAAGIILGSSGSNDKGSRDVQSAFVEVGFPITEKFELDAAARADHYSDFGTTANPKLSAKYTFNQNAMMRASLGTGFKAPTLSQLYGASSDGYITFIDRLACSKNSAACTADQYHVLGGGNKSLKEEKSYAASLGTVIQPTSSFSFSVDGWYTRVTDIVGIDYEDLTQAQLNGVDPKKYGVTVTRDNNGIIEDINAINLNLQDEEISGIDVNAEYIFTENFMGHRLSLEDDYSYIIFDNKEGFPGAGKRNIVREWGAPQWRNVATLSLKSDSTTLALALRSIPGQNVQDRNINQKVSDLNEFDLTGAYKFTKLSQISGGIKNIMNAKQPADMDGGTGGAAVVRNELYDVNGRKFFVSYTEKF